MSTILNWKKGRQNSGYYKLSLIESNLFKFDMHVLKMPTGSFINLHQDPITPEHKALGYNEHHRLNIVIKRAFGGIFWSKSLGRVYDRIIRFRPDIDQHSVKKVEHGTRYVLSIGWLKNANKFNNSR